MWQKACRLEALAPGSGLAVNIGGKEIALFNAGSEIYAIANVCPHQGGPLGEGTLQGKEVTCPWHAWQFNVQTGECLTTPGVSQQRYAVKVENGDVFVET